jgi:tetratricopeptide (TPR) repeat protein
MPPLNQAAESFKAVGNEYFRKGDIEQAIVYYTQAIEKDPEQHTYWTNRALCYMKQMKWEMVCLAFFLVHACMYFNMYVIYTCRLCMTVGKPSTGRRTA